MAGRPKKQIDVEILKKLAAIHCTWEEMESILYCSRQTLERHFGQVIEEARNTGKMSLRRKQYTVAVDQGSVPMLIWLGKQYLDQRDKRDVEEIKFHNKEEAIQRLRDTADRLEIEVKAEQKV